MCRSVLVESLRIRCLNESARLTSSRGTWERGSLECLCQRNRLARLVHLLCFDIILTMLFFFSGNTDSRRVSTDDGDAGTGVCVCSLSIVCCVGSMFVFSSERFESDLRGAALVMVWQFGKASALAQWPIAIAIATEDECNANANANATAVATTTVSRSIPSGASFGDE